MTQGRKWLNYKETIMSQKWWRVTFEGLSGKTTVSNLALDDLSLSPGKCPPKRTCDFEVGKFLL